MELNALTRWNSVGKDLHILGQLEQEIARLTQLRDIRLAEQRDRQNRSASSSGVVPAASSLSARARAENEEREGHYYRSLVNRGVLPVPSPTASPTGSESYSPPAIGSSSSNSSSSSSTSSSSATASTTSTTSTTTTSLSSSTLSSVPVPLTKPPRTPISVRQFLYRSALRFAKGFAVGYGGKAMFGLLPVIIRSRGNLAKIWAAFKAIAFQSPLQYGCFLGAFLSIFESVMRISLQHKQWFGLSPNTRPLVAGSLAGVSLLFAPRESRSSIMLFFLVRALELLTMHLVERGYVPAFQHADTLLMSIASSQVIWTWMFNPAGLDPTYLRFMDAHGGWGPSVKAAFGKLTSGNSISAADIVGINKAHGSMGVPPPTLSPGKVSPRPAPLDDQRTGNSYSWPLYWSRC